MQVDLMMHRR